jgi:hypothetical protein
MKPVPVLTAVFAAMISVSTFAEDSSELEPLYSAQFDDTYVTVEVKSNGCTQPEDFTILASGKSGEHITSLGIRRDKPDFCKAMPQLVRLQLELPPALAALKEPYWLENLFVSKSQFPGLVGSPSPEN